MQDHSSPEDHDTQPNNRMRPELVFIGLTTLFLICFWIWFLLLRPPAVDPLKQAIQKKAIEEILSACNAALVINGKEEYFHRKDIEINADQPVDGVSPFVTMLSASRNGLACRWDGVNPVILTRGDSLRPQHPQGEGSTNQVR